jgi:hypothetical protein
MESLKCLNISDISIVEPQHRDHRTVGVDNAGQFRLVFETSSADIYFDRGDHKVVHIAADKLSADIYQVTGIRPQLKNAAPDARENSIIIGTIGSSRFIDDLAASGKLDISAVRGKWEAFIITIIDGALVIAGSDRRGTAYGAFTISEQIGVSPWHWWADVPVKKRENLTINLTKTVYKSPSVKYRGIFINDEAWGLHPWAARTFDPQTADIGPKTYDKIFELVLRLKANLVWPAMHSCTKAFNLYPANRVLADDYAIVMGSSHCEPMLRNNVSEWDCETMGVWDYTLNRDNIYNYWRDRVKENRKYENIYTLGMRGIHDEQMPGSPDIAERVKLLQRIIDDQRQILRELVNDDVAKVPQVICLYKEVLHLYQNGLNIPDDVTIIWPDDNRGFIRQLPEPAIANRSGGHGIYYHVSYKGLPNNYLWLNSTSPALIWEQMSKAYAYNARNLWILNIGDIKPREISSEFFLKIAYNINSYDNICIDDFFTDWASREFPARFSNDISIVLKGYFRLVLSRKPEDTLPGLFSLCNYGDEGQKRIDKFEYLLNLAEDIYASLPQKYKDSFYQQVLYALRCTTLINKKCIYADKNRFCASNGIYYANQYANKARLAHEKLQIETAYFNNILSGGKWKHIISTWTNRYHEVYQMPKVSLIEPAAQKDAFAVIAEGMENFEQPQRLPQFCIYTNDRYFIDIYNNTKTQFQWNAKTSDRWLRVSETSGTLDGFRRLWVEIAPELITECTTGVIELSACGITKTVNVQVSAAGIPTLFKGFIEKDGIVSINACNYSRKKPSACDQWSSVSGLGHNCDVMTIYPQNTAGFSNIDDIIKNAPVLEYDFYALNSGAVTITTYCVPAHKNNSDMNLCYAIGIDEHTLCVTDTEAAEYTNQWSQNVMRAMTINHSSHVIDKIGAHTLKLYMVDPGLLIEKIVIQSSVSIKESYFGPPQTIVNCGTIS